MSFFIVVFGDDEVGVVHNKWLTPKKTNAYWPPIKNTSHFRKALTRGEEPNPNWSLCKVNKVLYETENLDRALKKQEEAEITSNLSSDEDNFSPRKRIRRAPRKYLSSDSDNDESLVKRPPRLENIPLLASSSAAPSLNATDSDSLQKTPKKQKCRSGGPEECTPLHTTIPSPNSCCSKTNDSSILETPTIRFPESSSSDKLDSILTRLVKIENQNSLILGILRQKKSEIFGIVPDDCINSLPLKNVEELTDFESKISSEEVFKSLVSYMSQIGGEGTVSRTNKILRFVFNDELASLFNFCGHNSKRPFIKLKLKDAIIHSIQSKEKTASKHDIEQCIKNWLKYAPKRIQISNSKK